MAQPPELGVTHAEGATTDVSACRESRNSSVKQAHLTGTLAKSDKHLHSRMKRTFGAGPKPNSPSDNSALLSPSHTASSNEAIDLTGYASRLTSPATKRKRQNINSTITSHEVPLHEPDNADVSVNEVNNCSGASAGIACIKTEVPTAADVDTDWSSSVNASMEGNSLNELATYCWKTSGPLDKLNSAMKEDATATSANASEQVLCALL